MSKIPYINGIPIPRGPRGLAGPDGNPIGTVIPLMGTIPPKDYLACDGAIYNISDYPNLANHFESQLGSSNYFGGDGETTFGVPNLQDLFLRGYNPNEDSLSGEIGEKQEGSMHPYIYGSGYGNSLIVGIPEVVDPPDIDPFTTTIRPRNTDSELIIRTNSYSSSSLVKQLDNVTDTVPSFYTARPANMAVLYCIKAVESIPGGGGLDVYSEEETVIGRWINGKPLYRNVFHMTAPSTENVSTGSSTTILEYNADVETVVTFNAYLRYYDNEWQPFPMIGPGGLFSTIAYYGSVGDRSVKNVFRFYGNHGLGQPIRVILEYTKTTD